MDKLRGISTWSVEEKETLFRIAIDNSQVFYILGDPDITAFYKKILRDIRTPTVNAQKVKEVITKLEEQ